MLQRFYDLQKMPIFSLTKIIILTISNAGKIFKITLIYFYFGMQPGICDLYFL